MARDALEGQRRPQKHVGRRLEAVAKSVGGGYCRLQMPLNLALGARETVAGHRLGGLEGGGYLPPSDGMSHRGVPPPLFQCIPGCVPHPVLTVPEALSPKVLWTVADPSGRLGLMSISRRTYAAFCFLRLPAAAAVNAISMAMDETEIRGTRKRSIDGTALLQWGSAGYRKPCSCRHARCWALGPCNCRGATVFDHLIAKTTHVSALHNG